MSFHPPFSPVHMEHESDVSSFNDVFNESGEVAFKEYSSLGEEDNLLFTASNCSGALASQPASPYVTSFETSATQNFGSQSSDSSNSSECFENSICNAGGDNGTAGWNADLGDSNMGNLQPHMPATPGFEIGRQPPRIPDYDNAHNYGMTSMPLDFAMSTPMSFFQSTNQSVSATETTNYWTTSLMDQGSSSYFSATTTSAATQTPDSPIIHNSQDEQNDGPRTRNPSRISKNHLNRRTSRNFSCGINGCAKFYQRVAELQRHQRTHYGVRDHSCRFRTCNRAAPNGFARKDHLKQHLRQVHKTTA